MYTYTVSSASCGTASATVTVTLENPANAGNASTLNICPNSTPLNLFTFLGPGTTPGGTWSPALSSGTNIYSPAQDGAGPFTYTVGGTLHCPPSQSTVTINFLPLPSAGNFTGLQQVCQSTVSFDLFNLLDGSQTPGGIWVNSSGNIIPSVINPPLFPPGTYSFVYLVSNPCQSSSIIVQLQIVPLPNLTSDQVSITTPICQGQEGIISISGLPDGNYEIAVNGSGANVFTGEILAFTSLNGVAIATIPSGLLTQVAFTDIQITSITSLPLNCSRTVNLTLSLEILPLPNATTTIFEVDDICLGDALTLNSTNVGNLTATSYSFTYNISQNGGIVWGGTGAFDVINNAFQWILNDVNWQQQGIFEFFISSITNVETGCTSQTNILIPFNVLVAPEDVLIGISVNENEICVGDTPVLTLQLPINTDLNLNAELILTGAITANETIVLEFVNGTATFPLNFNFDQIGNVTVELVINDLVVNNCGTANYNVPQISFIVVQPETPILEVGGNEFCASSNPTLADLNALVTSQEPVQWFADADFTQALTLDVLLVNGQSYFAVAVSANGCQSEDALEVMVTLTLVQNPIRISNDTFCASDEPTLADLSLQMNVDNADLLWFASADAISSLPLDTPIQNGQTYFAQAQDTNGCLSERIPVLVEIETVPTPILISPPSDFCEQDNATLNELEVFINAQGFDLVWYSSSSSSTSLPLSTTLVNGATYYVEAISASGCVSSRLPVTVIVENCINDIRIPDGFSPNDDGINDSFEILFLRDLYPNFVLEIYNRYGTLIYKGNTNTADWDGTSNQKGVQLEKGKLPVGVYFFVLEFNDGERKPIQGRVYLNR